MDSQITRLEAAEAEFASAVEGVDDSLIRRSVASDGWSIGDIVSHVSEMPGFWGEQVDRIVAGGEPSFGRTERDEKRLAALEANRQRSAADLIAMAKESLETLRLKFATLSPGQLEMAGTHIIRGRMTASDVVEMHIAHVHEHATEIRHVRSALAG